MSPWTGLSSTTANQEVYPTIAYLHPLCARIAYYYLQAPILPVRAYTRYITGLRLQTFDRVYQKSVLDVVVGGIV